MYKLNMSLLVISYFIVIVVFAVFTSILLPWWLSGCFCMFYGYYAAKSFNWFEDELDELDWRRKDEQDEFVWRQGK